MAIHFTRICSVALSKAIRPLAVGILLSLLAACAVGPDYVRPPLPQLDEFASQEVTQDALPQPADVEFWRSFEDPLLERLVDSALTHNRDLRIALANYKQANALLRQGKFDRLPTLTASAEASSVHTGDANQSQGRDDYQIGFGAIWELDFFGRLRRSVEAQRAETQASAADLSAMQVSVVGELARSYFQLRSLQEQRRIARESAENQSRTQQLLQLRHEAGAISGFDVDRGRAQLESTYAHIPALDAEVAFATHRIAVLIGSTPASMAKELSDPGKLPARSVHVIAPGSPGELLRRRPDVAAAERRLAAATARIGVVTADLFPRFTLGGLIGAQALEATALFQRDNEIRMLTLGIDGSFLNVGRVRSRIAAADAVAAANLAAYERAVLVALEETENALVRVFQSGREVGHLQRAADANARAAAVARVRFDNGAIDVLAMLDAERTNLLAESAYAQGQLRHAQSRVLLFQTLAGGWQVPEVKSAGNAPINADHHPLGR